MFLLKNPTCVPHTYHKKFSTSRISKKYLKSTHNSQKSHQSSSQSDSVKHTNTSQKQNFQIIFLYQNPSKFHTQTSNPPTKSYIISNRTTFYTPHSEKHPISHHLHMQYPHINSHHFIYKNPLYFNQIYTLSNKFKPSRFSKIQPHYRFPLSKSIKIQTPKIKHKK